MVALMSPEDSWVGRWQRIGMYQTLSRSAQVALSLFVMVLTRLGDLRKILQFVKLRNLPKFPATLYV